MGIVGIGLEVVMEAFGRLFVLLYVALEYLPAWAQMDRSHSIEHEGSQLLPAHGSC